MYIKSVFITGANRGIGLEFVKQLLELSTPPSYIFASCRSPSKAQDLQSIAKANPSVKVVQLDVKDIGSFTEIRKQLEEDIGDIGLNLLINNAGILLRKSLNDVSKESMLENFEVNAVSPLLLTKELLPLLTTAAKSGGNSLSCGRAGVVNITSKMGSIDDNTSGSDYPYRTSKAALNMITRSLSVDLKPKGILVFALHPGWVLTDMGGPSALINTQTSVENMIGTILKSSDCQSGLMLNYDGKPIPW